MIGSVLILCACLFLSFFFSGTETAFTAASLPLMHEMEKKGNKRAKIVTKVKAKSDRFLGMILFGNNVVNIAATAITTSICITLLGQRWGVFISTFVVSFVILIFCEIMPKTYAIRNPNTIALFVAPVVQLLTFLLAPLVAFVNSVVKNVMAILGLLKHEKLGDSAKTELRGVLNMQTSVSIRSEKNMMKSVLDLSEVEVHEVMTYRSKIVSFDVNTEVKTLIEKVLNCPYTRIPLWKERKSKIVGVLNTKLLLRALQARHGDLTNFDVMSVATAPWFIPETTTLLTQLQAYRRRREHFAIVVDEYGETQGIVTLEDILEEIVGDIIDETDNPPEASLNALVQPDGTIMVDGSASIRDLNRNFGWDLPDDQASTIAGLLLYETERIPKKGASYSFYGFTFKVLDKKGNRITKMLITAPEKEAEEQI